jgi:murein DD-endopeptidase MepM/ murein hydrolase activator NlpD
MNVILVPKSAGRGRNISLSHGQLLAVALVTFVMLPVVIGTVTYKIVSHLDAARGVHNPEYIAQQERKLLAERQSIETARRNAETHLNALAQRLGHMQAQLLRLNALGQRLVSMAGLDRREFNFSEEPAMGGPEGAHTSSANVPDFLRSMENVAHQIDRKTERLMAVESMMMDRQLQDAVHPAGWPATDGGWVSSGFGLRTDPFSGHTAFHEGVDIASRYGSPIKAVGGGVVSYAGPKQGYGLVVEVNHGNGYTTRYAHASAVLVKVGDRIEKSQHVALVGSSGRSTGPHLHFEVLRNGQAVNPRSYLKTNN